ncbi:hypothetical protein CR513_33117, partial [Mucuna pruriens]
MVSMEAKHILLGRLWKFNRKLTHDGVANMFSFEYMGQKVILKPLSPREEKITHKKEVEFSTSPAFELDRSLYIDFEFFYGPLIASLDIEPSMDVENIHWTVNFSIDAKYVLWRMNLGMDARNVLWAASDFVDAGNV